MNIFGWRKNLAISEQDPTFKVRYLGNVQTSVMKGEGCTDRAVNVIWSTYTSSDHPGVEMKVVLTSSGIKAYTKEQGLTEYRAHRISYCIAHPMFPRVFVWIYRHEGRRMKMELRCHAVLCSSDAKAKAMALRLHEKLSSALREFQREKLRKQTSRLALQRTSSLPSASKTGALLPLRTQLLSTGGNFRGSPTPGKGGSAAVKLGAITEDSEEEEELMRALEEGDDDDEEEVIDALTMRKKLLLMKRASAGGRLEDNSNNNDSSALNNNGDPAAVDGDSLPSTPCSAGPRTIGLIHHGEEHHGIVQALDLESASSAQGASSHNTPAVPATSNSSSSSSASKMTPHENGVKTPDSVISLEVGNDLEELRRDDQVLCCLGEAEEIGGQQHDSDEESAESGFHDQECGNGDSEQDQDLLADNISGDSGEFQLQSESKQQQEFLEAEIDELTVCRYPSVEENLKSSSTQKTAL